MRSEAFDGEDYHEFAQLVESIQRTDALRDRVSERTIADYAFDWFKETRRLGTSLALTDYILERVNASVRPLEVCVPIAMLSLESPVSIGRVILRSVDRETLDQVCVDSDAQRDQQQPLPVGGGLSGAD